MEIQFESNSCTNGISNINEIPIVDNLNTINTTNNDKKMPLKCEMCCETSAKYRCPRCNTRTCSLSCVKSHKTKQSCTGVKDPTEFVKISKFNTGNLLRGFHLCYLKLVFFTLI